MEVVDCTEPGAADKATLSSFRRNDAQHQDAATKAWRESQRTQTYLGEWHSHPFGQPEPSGIDKRHFTTAAAIAPLVESENGSTGIVFR